MNHMIDEDSGSDCRSPLHNPDRCPKCREPHCEWCGKNEEYCMKEDKCEDRKKAELVVDEDEDDPHYPNICDGCLWPHHKCECDGE